jgi:hypothetical protein
MPFPAGPGERGAADGLGDDRPAAAARSRGAGAAARNGAVAPATGETTSQAIATITATVPQASAVSQIAAGRRPRPAAARVCLPERWPAGGCMFSAPVLAGAPPMSRRPSGWCGQVSHGRLPFGPDLAACAAGLVRHGLVRHPMDEMNARMRCLCGTGWRNCRCARLRGRAGNLAGGRTRMDR